MQSEKEEPSMKTDLQPNGIEVWNKHIKRSSALEKGKLKPQWNVTKLLGWLRKRMHPYYELLKRQNSHIRGVVFKYYN